MQMNNTVLHRTRKFLYSVGILLVSNATIYVAFSQPNLRALKEPPEMETLRGPERGGDVRVTLDIKYADNQIYNPTTGQFDKVHLRSYNGDLVGPTIRVKPGDALNVKLINNLPAKDPSCPSTPGDHNIPNCFNSTNLHTHGFHVSPSGNSDNVLLVRPPQSTFDYVFNLPKNHPAGTFWYHSHRHGSTALQVSSGMAGALIVKGDRPVRDKATNGVADVDTILKYPGGRAFDEHLLLFEQIQYACGTKQEAGQTVINWDCTGKIGDIEQYGDQFGPRTWPASGRYTLINGKVQPTWSAKTGRIQRWRMIHGGVRDTIKMKIVSGKTLGLTASAFGAKAMTITEQRNWIAENCQLDKPVSQWEFAVDGLTRTAFNEKLINVFQPGYRSDVLVVFNQPGTYCVIDEQAPADSNINAQTKDRRLLGLVSVSGTAVSGDPKAYLIAQLLTANRDLPPAVKKDLAVLKLTEYSPFQDIPSSAVTGRQSATFFIDTSVDPLKFEIDGKPYDPARVDRTLVLNSVDEWTLTSNFVNHPFHIHVNPFQIVEILNAKGQPVLDSSGKCVDADSSGNIDTQYCDQIGVFRDTIFVKQNYHLKVRSRYETFIGDFVLHCHILDHEDQGMMQNVTIVPEGTPTSHERH